MPRRREVPKREMLPDPKFSSQEVAKFINVLMTRGKKSVAERIVYGALDQISKKSGKDPLEVFDAGAQQREADGRGQEPPRRWRQLPGAGRSTPGSPHCAGDALVARCGAQARREVDGARLANELVEAAEGRGGAVKKREEVHRMAEANKAFAHYRF